jgi:hypothetical protein
MFIAFETGYAGLYRKVPVGYSRWLVEAKNPLNIIFNI